ncbi:hypothetical protein [Pseudomonas jessenii]|uniref:hypothetical protein n=1 Tax=Pseudomonas jessenii TaxID=77298 RepID=UPI0030C1AAAF
MVKSKQAHYWAFVKAVDAGELPSPETMKAVADLMRPKLKRMHAGRPRRALIDLRRGSGLVAAVEVETRVEAGETYAKARSEVSQKRRISTRTLGRYVEVAKHFRILDNHAKSWDGTAASCNAVIESANAIARWDDNRN